MPLWYSKNTRREDRKQDSGAEKELLFRNLNKTLPVLRSAVTTMPPRKLRQNIKENKMNRTRFLIGAAALSCAVIITGCVDTAPNQLSEMEQNWARVIGESYPGHRIPKTMPPAVRGSLVVDESAQRANTPAAPAAPAADSDPAAMVDKAAASTPAEDVVPEPKEQPAPVVKEEKAVEPVKVQEPAAAPKFEEKKAEEPAAAPKVEEKKAEEPAAAPTVEEKKADKPARQGAEAVVKAGDTLTGLAKEFYGDAKYYDVILKANPQIKNPKRLKIGTKLVIPAL